MKRLGEMKSFNVLTITQDENFQFISGKNRCMYANCIQGNRMHEISFDNILLFSIELGLPGEGAVVCAPWYVILPKTRIQFFNILGAVICRAPWYDIIFRGGDIFNEEWPRTLIDGTIREKKYTTRNQSKKIDILGTVICQAQRYDTPPKRHLATRFWLHITAPPPGTSNAYWIFFASRTINSAWKLSIRNQKSNNRGQQQCGINFTDPTGKNFATCC